MPKLGIITMDDYTLPEMPIPNMVNIDKFKFDFKASTRNADFRAGKQYESLGLKKICPNLYVKKFKVRVLKINLDSTSLLTLCNLIERASSASNVLR